MSDFWSAVKEALRGSRQDFTEVPIRRAILLLAVPMILEMGMESLFVVVDIFWVSRLGADAVAAVGLTEAMLTIIYTVAIGLAAITIAWSTYAVVSATLFKRGRWKLKKV